MADLSYTDLLSLIQANGVRDKAIAESDPYAQWGQVPELGSQLVLQGAASGAYSPKEILIGGLLTGLGQGLFSGASKSYQSRAKEAYDTALGASLAGQDLDRPAVLDQDVFDLAKKQGLLFKLQKGAAREKAAQDLQTAGMEAYLKSQMGKKGEFSAYDNMEANDAASFLDPRKKAVLDYEGKIYDRITKSPTYVQFSDIDKNFQALKALAPLDNRAASVGMISSLARIWDPEGTVREGEYRLNAAAQSALDDIYGGWREVVEGKGRLSPQAKNDIIQAAGAKYNEFGKAYEAEREAQYQALEKLGGSRANIPTFDFEPFEGFGGGGSPNTPAPNIPESIEGMEITADGKYFVDHKTKQLIPR